MSNSNKKPNYDIACTASEEGTEAPAEAGPILKTNKSVIIPFMVCILFGSIHVGFSMSSANQLAATFNAKYGWAENQ